jgi:LysM repeat protein/predicted RNA-binding Zn-ribbon protein involved in translation (DUF1610 family)
MVNKPAQGGELAPAGGSGTSGMRMAGVRSCPSCDTPINVHATVCPNCGEHVAVKEKFVRCRRCRRRASSNLVVCPHCGRELQPATTRWLTWGVPLLVLALLMVLLLVRLSRGNPAEWAARQGQRLAALVESMGSRLQPEFTVAMIPPEQDADDPLVAQAIQAGAEAGADVTTSGQPDVLQVAARPDGAPPTAGAEAGDDPEAAGVPAEAAGEQAPVDGAPALGGAAQEAAQEAAVVTATVTAEPAAAAVTSTPTMAATASATDVPVQEPTAAATQGTASTPVLTAALSPGATATISPDVSLLDLMTPTPVTSTPAIVEVYEVRRGDTLFDIARQYELSVDDLLVANNMTEDDVYTIQPGDELNIPAPTPEGAPTATPRPAPDTYTVRAGDTLMEIAQELDVTMEELLTANDLTLGDARSLQPGDVLELPGAEPAPTATLPAASPTASPTTVPTMTPAATQTPAVTATSFATTPATAAASATDAPGSALRLDAPRLRSPEDGAAVSCSGEGTLHWLAVPSTRADDLYLVHLGYVNSIAAGGAEEIIWVLTQQRPAGTTSWQLDNDLCGLAPTTEGRQWRWYVEVAEKTADGLQPVSPSSEVWGFAWQ